MKFKVGDKVKLIKIPNEGTTNGFELGDICEITSININGIHKIRISNKESCGYVSKEHIKLIKDQFTKSDLQNGDIVTYRDGQKRTVVCNKLINEDGTTTNYLTMYEDNLTYKDRQKDIVKVERPVQYETIFERKEEILDETEKRYLTNVIRPFRDKVESIVKCGNERREYIHIELKEDVVNFPYFETNTMYQGMEAGKDYTLEELGL